MSTIWSSKVKTSTWRRWVYDRISALSSTGAALGDLTDVGITSVTSGEVLKYDGAGSWINNTLAEAGIAAASHTHVEADITDLGAYITDITAEPLSDLSDVTITTIASGEILKWSGTAWINNTLAEAGIAAVGEAITNFDGTAWRVFYTNGTGDVTELALGAANTVLTSNGASAAPSFEAAAAGAAFSELLLIGA